MCLFLTFGVEAEVYLKPIFECHFLVVLFQLVLQSRHLALSLLDFMQDMLVLSLEHVERFPIIFSFPS